MLHPGSLSCGNYLRTDWCLHEGIMVLNDRSRQQLANEGIVANCQSLAVAILESLSLKRDADHYLRPVVSLGNSLY